MFCSVSVPQLIQKTLQHPSVRRYGMLITTKRHEHNLALSCKQNLSSTFHPHMACNEKFFSQAADAKKQTEEEFLVRLKNNPDAFGAALDHEEPLDEADLKEEQYFEEQASPAQKLRIKQYSEIIKEFIRKRKIKEAIDVLEVKMLKEDQVKPNAYIYNLLLGGCGRVGYTKKAFSLYNQMKKRGFKAMGGTYTALFNACSNSPWPEDGLSRARHLQNIMLEKMYEPNVTNYHAMIKAFGRCGDLATAFSLVDEMTAKKMPTNDNTMNFLLHACIQDKEAGFRHSLLIWRKMVRKHIPPSLYTYNLLLRSIRDCGIGDLQVMSDTINILLQSNTPQIKAGNNKLLLESSTNGKLIQDNVKLEVPNHQTTPTELDLIRPNLMAKTPHLGNIVSISDVTKAEDRLLLVGGFKGFLENMAQHNCKPDIKTFTQLLDCLPGSMLAEQELLKAMKALRVKPDIDFFNMLIKKRSMRFDYDGGRAVLDEMKNFGYRPNLITFGVLSLGCKTKEEALELLAQMKGHSYRLNTEILGAMLSQACHHKNFSYVLEIMETTLKEEVKPNKIFMECLKFFKNKCKHISNDKDHKLYSSTAFQKGFRVFQMRYKTWLEEVEVDDSEDAHPWAQYRQTTETDTRHYQDKAARFKAKHLSKFKVKTSTKRR